MRDKIGLLTFLHNENYGSSLQAYALQKTVQMLHSGVVEHIDYALDSKEKLYNLITSGNSPKLLLDGLQKRRVKGSQDGARAKAEALRLFRQEKLLCSAPCRNHAALEAQSAAYAAIIAGSDQIWSPVWLNPAYYLNFGADNMQRIAYAPSFGVKQVTSRAKAAKIAGYIKRFQHVSVREEAGAAIVKELTGKRVPVLPDPVCLLTREEWLQLAALPEQAEPYLLCYCIGSNPAYYRQAAEMAKKMQLQLRIIPVTEEAYHQDAVLLSGIAPEAWVGAIAGAAHVLTDSFHGCVFSAILGKDFTPLRRYAENDPTSKNSRIDTLLNSLGMTWDAQERNWETAERRLADMRNKGIHWLDEALRDVR